MLALKTYFFEFDFQKNINYKKIVENYKINMQITEIYQIIFLI
jgi:hypothetical protein